MSLITITWERLGLSSPPIYQKVVYAHCCQEQVALPLKTKIVTFWGGQVLSRKLNNGKIINSMIYGKKT